MNKTPISNIDPAELIQQAMMAASEATAQYLSENSEWYPCGFAWVNIKPARGPVVAKLKDLNLGYSDSYLGGYTVYNPSKNSTQSMYAKEAGARAFANIFKAHDVKVSVGTRMD